MGGIPRVYLTDDGILRWPELLRRRGYEVTAIKESEAISFFHIKTELVLLMVVQYVDPVLFRNEFSFRPTNDEGREVIESIQKIFDESGIVEDH